MLALSAASRSIALALVQPEFLLGQVFRQQAAQLRRALAVKALKQVFGLGHISQQILNAIILGAY